MNGARTVAVVVVVAVAVAALVVAADVADFVC